jgi:hypothetical protein
MSALEVSRMAKKWYQYLVTSEAAETAAGVEADARPAAAPPEVLPEASTPAVVAADGDALPSFDEIYAAARIEAPAHGYTILKIADMLRSEHIAALPPEVKKKSVLLALDAAGVPLDAIIDDAVRRDRALDMFERTQEKALAALEQKVRADERQLQQEIDALIADRQAKIRAANEAMAREAAAVKGWRDRKAAEEARIADAVGHFLAENPITIGQPDSKTSSKA